MTAPAKIPPLLAEFVAFVRATNLAEPPIDYLAIPKHMNDAGWEWRARQTNAQLGAQSILIDYEISVGKAEALDKMAVVDTISMGTPLGVFNPSMSSRLNLGMSVLYLLFDRLPPMQAQPQPAARAEGDARPMTDAEIAALRTRTQPAPMPNGHDPDPEPAAEVPVADTAMFDDLPDVVDGFLKSGMPLFKDVDAMGGAADDLVEAMLSATSAALEVGPSAPEQLVEFFERNKRQIGFLKEMCSPEQNVKFVTMLNAKNAELSGGTAEPPVRRRQPSA